jgi:hypothetical protein
VALSRVRWAAAITTVTTLALLVVASSGAPRSAREPVTTITAVDGAVLVSHDGDDFLTARVGDVLTAGDTVRTAESSAEITYAEGSSVRVEPNSEVVVRGMPPASEPTTLTSVAQQVVDRTWHVVGQLVNGPSRYGAGVRGMTASVRG